jgi:hypothetical protein
VGSSGTGGQTGGAAGSSGTGGSSGAGSGGTAGTAGSVGTAGSAGTSGSAGSSGTGGALVWPNEESSTNSDAWLVEHHDQLTKVEPRVLLVNFADGVSEQEAVDKAEAIIGAVAEGSRYHGYSNPDAPPFVEYKIAHVVNMPGEPLRSGNHFGYVEFMTGQNFAGQVAFPGNESLTVCQLFEQGLINEAWVVETADDSAKLYEQKTLGQQYDDNLQKIPGDLDRCAGNGCIEDAFECGVTVRLHEVNPDRGPGCATHAWGHGIESQVRTRQIPYFTANASRFFNFNLDDRHDTPFGDFYMCPYNNQTCIEYVTSTHLRNGPASPQTFDIPAFGDGCGNVHFASHSRYQYDYENGATGTGRATCEGYGLGNGGAEMQTDISYATYQALNQNRAYNDCGGGWQIYMRQSFPGYGNAATDVNGGPMKNWWPFLFY